MASERSNSFQSVSGPSQPVVGTAVGGAANPAPWPRQPPSISTQRRHGTPERRGARSPRGSTSVRHGSGAVAPSESSAAMAAEPTRQRSRDRDRSMSHRNRAANDDTGGDIPRSLQMAIDRLEITVATLESASRSHAHTLSVHDQKCIELNERLNGQSKLIHEIDARSKLNDAHLRQACANIVDQFQYKAAHEENINFGNARVESLTQEMQRLERAIAAAASVDANPQVSSIPEQHQSFNVSTVGK